MNKYNRDFGPRRKWLTRNGRLQAAKIFIEQYSGQNLFSDYRKWFAVSSLCAATELKMLGLDTGDLVIKAQWSKMKKAKVMKEKEVEEARVSIPDEYYAFLYGFTSIEEPYGVTWERGTKSKLLKRKKQKGIGKQG